MNRSEFSGPTEPCSNATRTPSETEQEHRVCGFETEIPMNDYLTEELHREWEKFKDYYGREPHHDPLLSFAPVYNDELLLDAMAAMQEAEVSPSYIYAYYKTDGLIPCSLNEDVMPEDAKAEFEEYEQEYRRIMETPFTESIHAMQFVSLVNGILADRMVMQDMLIDSLNDFIHRHSPQIRENSGYNVQTELDYLLFSALKTIKTLKGIRTMSDCHFTECIISLGRSLFENYLYLSKLNCDDTFFERKLLP